MGEGWYITFSFLWDGPVFMSITFIIPTFSVSSPNDAGGTSTTSATCARPWFFYLLCLVVFFLMGVRLVTRVWVLLVVRWLVFIIFYCVDLLVFIGIFIVSVVGGWLASLVS